MDSKAEKRITEVISIKPNSVPLDLAELVKESTLSGEQKMYIVPASQLNDALALLETGKEGVHSSSRAWQLQTNDDTPSQSINTLLDGLASRLNTVIDGEQSPKLEPSTENLTAMKLAEHKTRLDMLEEKVAQIEQLIKL